MNTSLIITSAYSTQKIVWLWSETANHGSGISFHVIFTRQFSRDKVCFIGKIIYNERVTSQWSYEAVCRIGYPRLWKCMYFVNMFQTHVGFPLSKFMLICAFSNICFKLMLVIHCLNVFVWNEILVTRCSYRTVYYMWYSKVMKMNVFPTHSSNTYSAMLCPSLSNCMHFITYVSNSCWYSIVKVYYVFKWNTSYHNGMLITIVVIIECFIQYSYKCPN